ncbi:response regulator [Magnetococcus sp. PR-3]|uniref:response regulator n=1 Tax=Magnetococcus sp. PR-3 TaxID=3120355 RepID=UPI002FCE5DF6
MSQEPEQEPLVLTIDDEKAIRISIRMFLEEFGYQVIEATNGQEGLEVFDRMQPDLVLVDLRMPVMNGLQVLAGIRERSPQTPVVVISGTGAVGDVVEALRLGAWDYLLKPIQDMMVLEHTASTVLERARLLRENQEHHAQLKIEVAQQTQALKAANDSLTTLNQRLQAVVKSAHTLSACDTVSHFGQQMLMEFSQHMQVKGGSFYRMNGDQLVRVAVLDGAHAPSNLPMPKGRDTVFGQALYEKQPVLMADIGQHPQVTGSGWAGYVNGSLLVFPLLNRSHEVVGLVALHDKIDAPFISQDMEVGLLLASYSCEVMQTIRQKEQVQARQQQFTSLAEAAQDAIITTDDQGLITFWNRAAQNLFHYRAQDVVGQPIEQLLAADQQGHAKALADAINTAQGALLDHVVEMQGVTKMGVVFPMALSLATWLQEQRRYFSVMIRDITQRKQAEEKLLAAKEAADAANEAKSQFLAVMSHEMRTPLNAVLGMGEMLAQSTLNPKQQEWLNILIRSGQGLLALISDILDMRTIEAGRITLDSQGVVLQQLVDESLEVQAHGAGAKEVAITSMLDPPLPKTICCDSKRLRQILLNLLGNAIKFTEAGGTVALSVKNQAGSTLRFDVQDSGIGIAEEQQSQIFNPFFQVDSSITRQYGGSGLGLAISQQLVQSMAGRIGVQSTPGVGSQFWFEIPLQTPPAGPQLEPEHTRKITEVVAPKTNPLPGRSILIAEDAEDNRLLIKAYFKGSAHQITLVEDGHAAFEAFKQASFDLVLMDIQMPVMDGLQATEQIRHWEQQQGCEATPIVALTAHAMRGDEQQSLLAGCDAHITKPIRKATLMQVVTEQCKE